MSSQIQRAQMLIQSDRSEQAIEVMNDYLAVHPNDSEGHIVLGWAYSNLDQTKKGLLCVERGIGLEPDDYYGHYMKGCLLAGIRKSKAAMACFDEALRLRPDDADIYAERARIHWYEDEWEKALAEADAGLGHGPRNLDCWIIKATALIRLERMTEAADAIRGAAAVNANHAEVQTVRGDYALHHGDLTAARAHYLDALRLDSSDALAREGYLETLRADRWLFYWPVLLGRKLASRSKNNAKLIFRVFFRGSLIIAILAGADLLSVALVVPGFLLACVIFAPLIFLAMNWFDLALLLTADGRAVIEDRERKRLHWFLAGLAASFACLILAATIKWQFILATAAFMFGQIPVAMAYFSRTRKAVVTMFGIAIFCNALAIFGLVLELAQPGNGIGQGLQLALASAVFSLLGAWLGTLLLPGSE